MGGIRTSALRRTATVAVAAALAMSAPLIGAAPAGARAEDPPNVIGLSISDSRSELQNWNKAVVDPALTVRLGQGIALLDEERKPSIA